jgi:hypothetical protein
MGSFPYELGIRLRNELGLTRAVETGTYYGGTARDLAGLFGRVVTVELSADLFSQVSPELSELKNLKTHLGDSPTVLREVRDPSAATLYWLDAHWSGGATAGEANPCPLLDELESIRGGHPDDTLLIDDARQFATSRDPESWPTLVAALDAIRDAFPEHHVTVLQDLIIVVPARAKSVVDDWGNELLEDEWAQSEEPRRRGWPPPVPFSARLRRRIATAGRLIAERMSRGS